MSLWSRFMSASSAGVRAFRSAWMYNGPDESGQFADAQSRLGRYAVLWSYYEGQQYADIVGHASGLKVSNGLYKAIRSIYNPAGRLANFYGAYLLGGRISFDENGGISTTGAMPIETDNDALRLALAQIAIESNWQVMKDVLALRGTILGDGALMVRDEVDRVYVQNIHPASLVDVDIDRRGFVRGYKLSEARLDPETEKRGDSVWETEYRRVVTYTETAERDGDLVVYRTYRDGVPYVWNENQGAEWEEPYGFIPLVLIQHRNVGGSWGWSEFHQSLSKFNEVNDQASKLSDQIRKAVDSPWLFSGVDAPDETPKVGYTADTSTKTNQVRQETPIIYAPDGATATPLIAQLDIAGVTAHIAGILEELENDHPETRLVRLSQSGQASGEAIRTAQQPVEVLVNQRRAAYDDGIKRAFQMAVSIGGYRGLFPGFDLDSYKRGDMEMQISERPVFSISDEDKNARDEGLAKAAQAMLGIGYDPQHYLKSRGWSEQQIAELVNSGTYRNLTFAQYP